MGTMLEMNLLGPPIVRVSDERPAFTIAKGWALLYYVAITNVTHSREHLAQLLWPETNTEQALKNLRNLLTQMRPDFGAHLTITRATVSFNRHAVHWIDCAELIAAVKANKTSVDFIELSQATALYRGEFLQGFHLRDAAEYELWLTEQREAMKRRVVTGLDRLCNFSIKRGGDQMGITLANRLVALEPYREASHRLLMNLLALADERSAALAQFETARNLLWDAFGAEPSRSTVALYNQIRFDTTSVPDSPTPLEPFLAPDMSRTPLQTQIGHALRSVSYLYIQANGWPMARTYIDQCFEIAKQTQDTVLQASAQRLLGLTAWLEGDVYSAIQSTEMALMLCNDNDEKYGIIACTNNLSQFYAGCGALERSAELLEVLDDLSTLHGRVFTSWFSAINASHRGDHDASIGHARDALSQLAQHGEFFVKDHVINWLGHGLVGLGKLDAAEAAYNEGRTRFSEHSRVAQMLDSVAGLARIYLMRGALPVASAHVSTIMDAIDADPEHALDGSDDRIRVYVTCYKVLKATSDKRAAPLLSKAQTFLRAMADRIPDKTLRTGYLKNVPSHANLQTLS